MIKLVKDRVLIVFVSSSLLFSAPSYAIFGDGGAGWGAPIRRCVLSAALSS